MNVLTLNYRVILLSVEHLKLNQHLKIFIHHKMVDKDFQMLIQMLYQL